jgi:hypothetical protein
MRGDNIKRMRGVVPRILLILLAWPPRCGAAQSFDIVVYFAARAPPATARTPLCSGHP